MKVFLQKHGFYYLWPVDGLYIFERSYGLGPKSSGIFSSFETIFPCVSVQPSQGEALQKHTICIYGFRSLYGGKSL